MYQKLIGQMYQKLIGPVAHAVALSQYVLMSQESRDVAAMSGLRLGKFQRGQLVHLIIDLSLHPATISSINAVTTTINLQYLDGNKESEVPLEEIHEHLTDGTDAQPPYCSSGSVHLEATGPGASVNALLPPDAADPLCYVGCGNGTIECWELSNDAQRRVCQMKGHQGAISALARCTVSATLLTTLLLNGLLTPLLLNSLLNALLTPLLLNSLLYALLTPLLTPLLQVGKHRVLASASYDQMILLWSPTEHTPLVVLSSHQLECTALLGSSGRQLLSCTVRVWTVEGLDQDKVRERMLLNADKPVLCLCKAPGSTQVPEWLSG